MTEQTTARVILIGRNARGVPISHVRWHRLVLAVCQLVEEAGGIIEAGAFGPRDFVTSNEDVFVIVFSAADLDRIRERLVCLALLHRHQRFTLITGGAEVVGE